MKAPQGSAGGVHGQRHARCDCLSGDLEMTIPRPYWRPCSCSCRHLSTGQGRGVDPGRPPQAAQRLLADLQRRLLRQALQHAHRRSIKPTSRHLTLAWMTRVTAGTGNPGGGGRRGGAEAEASRTHRRRRRRGRLRRRRRHHQGVRARWWTARSISPCRTMPGPWTRATGANCGTTSGRPRAARTSAIAAWGCGTATCSWRRPTTTWSRSIPRPARSAGTRRLPIWPRATSPRRPRSWWGITCSWARATISIRPGFLQSFDPETGDLQWKLYTVPMKPGDPGLDTWASLDAARHGGAPDVDSGSLRSRDEALHLRHRQSDTGVHHGHARRRRQPVHLRADCGERGHRQDGLVFPDVAARHARLGFRADAGAGGRNVQRQDEEAGADGLAQRLLLRGGPRHRRAPR